MAEGFVNRIDELDAFRERLASGRAEYFVLYGRRRVGKSKLLLRIGEECRQLYFEATAGGRQDQLDDLSVELAVLTGRQSFRDTPLTSWRGAFTAFEELVEEGQLMIVLDEFQFIARQDPEVGSLINRFMRRNEANADLLLCISGSDSSFFEEEIMSYSATTYGRRTASLRLRPFRWRDASEFMSGWQASDRITAWSVFGGVPYYLKEIDPGVPLRETIRRSILNPEGLLRNEPQFLLAQESRIREPDVYMSSLRAIAAGVTRLNEIAQRVGKSRPEELRHFLDMLERMELVERRRPITEPGGKKVQYGLADPFLRFWFRFVAPAENRLLTREDAGRYLDDTVMPGLDEFVSEHGFEEVCRDWLAESSSYIASVGSWWGTIRVREGGRQRSLRYEADVAATDSAGKVVALGSCKWPGKSNTRHRHDAGELDKLERIRAHLGANDAPLYFFDRYGFSERLKEVAQERDDVRLVPVGDLDGSVG